MWLFVKSNVHAFRALQLPSSATAAEKCPGYVLTQKANDEPDIGFEIVIEQHV
jgi:hypothetical protein